MLFFRCLCLRWERIKGLENKRKRVGNDPAVSHFFLRTMQVTHILKPKRWQIQEGAVWSACLFSIVNV